MEVIKNGFKNERLGIELDVYMIGEKEWFRAKDISDFLEYATAKDMVRIVSFEENVNRHIMPNVVNPKGTLFINEFGLYEIICKINKADLKRYNKTREFQRWVFEEVLPSIRKSNSYVDDSNITTEQRLKLIHEQARRLENYSSLIGSATQNRSLKKFLENMFTGRIENPFEQFVGYMKLSGTLDNESRPTEKFRELNKKFDYFKWVEEVDHENRWRIEVKPSGMQHLLDTLSEKDGALDFSKKID